MVRLLNMVAQRGLSQRDMVTGKRVDVALTSKLKTSMLVQSALAMANRNMVSMVLVRRGDPDGGVVFVRLDHPDGTSVIESRVFDIDGDYVWTVLTGDKPLTSAEAEARLNREISFDPDCWVVAVDSAMGDNPLRGI